MRWCHLTPDRLILALLVIEGLLWLSERLGWPGWHKGYAVLTAVASVGGALLLTLGWFAVALVFHWRFQFSIRSLLVLVVVVAVPCSWFAVEMKAAAEQRKLVEWIQKPSGWVQYDYQFDGSNNLVGNARPPEAIWLCKLFGDDFFATITAVSLRGREISDTALERLTGLNQLRALYLAKTNVTDAGLEHVKGFTALHELWIAETPVTGAGLKHLKGLTQLQRLLLDRSQVSDAGLEHLEGLTQLQGLWLDYTNVTDKGLKHVKGLTQLQGLNIAGTRVTDAGLEHVKGLTQLQVLTLEDTQITDAGLEHLKGLTEIQSLVLQGTKVTDEGVKKLRQALPNCTIVWR